MALFFDAQWFDARLEAVGVSHATLAAALGLSETQLADVWKDQRELSAADVALIAVLLDVPADAVASHAGIATPVPQAPVPQAPIPQASVPIADARVIGDALRDLSGRLVHVETTLAEMKALLLELKRDKP